LIGQISDVLIRPDEREIAQLVVDRAIDRVEKLHRKFRVLIVIGDRNNRLVGVGVDIDIVGNVLLKKRAIRRLPVVTRDPDKVLHESDDRTLGWVGRSPLFRIGIPLLVEHRMHDLGVFREQIGYIAGVETLLIQHEGLGRGIRADVDSCKRCQAAQSAQFAGDTPALRGLRNGTDHQRRRVLVSSKVKVQERNQNSAGDDGKKEPAARLYNGKKSTEVDVIAKQLSFGLRTAHCGVPCLPGINVARAA